MTRRIFLPRDLRFSFPGLILGFPRQSESFATLNHVHVSFLPRVLAPNLPRRSSWPLKAIDSVSQPPPERAAYSEPTSTCVSTTPLSLTEDFPLSSPEVGVWRVKGRFPP